MKLLNGKIISNAIKDDLKNLVSAMKKDNQSIHLVVIQVGNDNASSLYVNNKKEACKYIGIKSMVYNLPENTTQETVIHLIENLNNVDFVNGILVQLPLPRHINEQEVLQRIHPSKDVDGFHAHNIGNLILGNDCIMPCTPAGIVTMLDFYNIDITGKECVVVGRSNIVGKPISLLLLQRDGTVTTCHSKTQDLQKICKRADVLICAIGKPKFFNKDYIKDGAVVVDVGIHRQENNKLCGDVDFDDVKDIVSAITPVPNGVGAMTVAMLMSNCVQAAQYQYKNKKR